MNKPERGYVSEAERRRAERQKREREARRQGQRDTERRNRKTMDPSYTTTGDEQ